MNNLENRVYLTSLYDLYGKILTQKQQLLFTLYYNDDYSLAEIADQEKMSRQGVHDHLKRAEERLKTFESELGFKERLENIENQLFDLKSLIATNNGKMISEKIDLLLEEVANGL